MTLHIVVLASYEAKSAQDRCVLAILEIVSLRRNLNGSGVEPVSSSLVSYRRESR
jgi:hypothetical protein